MYRFIEKFIILIKIPLFGTNIICFYEYVFYYYRWSYFKFEIGKFMTAQERSQFCQRQN